MMLVKRIESYCDLLGWGFARFGREFFNDPNLWRELRNGRTLEERNRKKIERILKEKGL